MITTPLRSFWQDPVNFGLEIIAVMLLLDDFRPLPFFTFPAPEALPDMCLPLELYSSKVLLVERFPPLILFDYEIIYISSYF